MLWENFKRDPPIILQLDVGQKFATLLTYDGPQAEDPKYGYLPAIFFGAVEAAYLALVTLVTHNVLLSIGTQAVGLSALYIIERLKWLSRDKQQS